MTLVERSIRLVLENVPIVMFVAALIVATFISDMPVMAERYLAWLLLLAVGVQGLWAGATHVFFPDVGARYIGWKASPFQTELGFADLAIGFAAVLSFWQGPAFKSAVVAYITVFYAGVGWLHVRERMRADNRAKGNFGALLAMTVVKAAGLPILLWLSYGR
jgi:hypothetical protein